MSNLVASFKKLIYYFLKENKMNFNQSLDMDDLQWHREELEELFSQKNEDVIAIDSATVHKCMIIYENTFVGEARPVEKTDTEEKCTHCEKGYFEIIHLRYLNVTMKKCKSCRRIYRLS
jgi:hypothetical protein